MTSILNKRSFFLDYIIFWIPSWLICKIGTEHERFGFEIATLRPMRYEQIAELLDGIAERFDWDKIMEGDKIIGLKQEEVKAVAEEMGIGFLRIGFQPKWGIKDIPIMPKVNLDFSSEADMIRKFRAGLALQPVGNLYHVLSLWDIFPDIALQYLSYLMN
ncbi:glutamate--cysteine ligase [Ancistrocladus abbreviatus]